ncbi:MAG TPA: hypothetical protein VE029_11165, partial [Rhizobacter sp.]|nr:hypothetical protein [Rhizobacter sp.]
MLYKDPVYLVGLSHGLLLSKNYPWKEQAYAHQNSRDQATPAPASFVLRVFQSCAFPVPMRSFALVQQHQQRTIPYREPVLVGNAGEQSLDVLARQELHLGPRATLHRNGRDLCAERATYETIFALLAGLGLRVGEVARLQCGDVDLEREVLEIRDTKFGKDRLVP